MSDSVLEAPARHGRANYVGGAWAPARSGRTYEKHNPARPSELVGEFPASGEDDVNTAVEAAAAAFPRSSRLPAPARGAGLAWRGGPVGGRRADIVCHIARLIGNPRGDAPPAAVRLV